ncbi:MAG: DEAD/DEAH box helicase [Thaumarchaeota archaeon]|nr:DEAD/DEAH box helicase [Nitrososphaerota archaeon]
MSLGLGAEREVLDRFVKAGWKEPLPIQRKSLPVLLRKRNALIVSPTGSGKTEAAVIPIFYSLGKEGRKGLRALYITPLRSLNRDIFRRVIEYAEREGLKVGVRHGDTPQSLRRKMVKEPPDVLITTPETLAVMLAYGGMREHLRTLEWVVIDELHELMESKRGTHLSVSLERLCEIAEEPVRVGLSATVRDLEKAARFLCGDRPCAILVERGGRGYEIEVRRVRGGILELVDELSGILKSSGTENVLVFTNTRLEAELVGEILGERHPDLPVEVHHGSLSKEVREEVERKLKRGGATVVCTSSLELGIDVGSIGLVVQIGSPRRVTRMLQRIGRSRHRLHEKARGIILVNELDDELESMALVRRARRGDLEDIELHENSLDVLAHHLVGLALEYGRLDVDWALSIVKRAYPFRGLGIEELKETLAVLSGLGIVGFDGKAFWRRRCHRYYFENVSTIPETEYFEVFDVSSNKRIGLLDHSFVGEYCKPDSTFVLKGKGWRVLSIDDSRLRVNVEPAGPGVSTIPYWSGELMPVEFETAMEAGKLRRSKLGDSEELKEFLEEFGAIPDHRTVVVEEVNGTFIVHACFGSRVNQTLGDAVSSYLSSKFGCVIDVRSDPYRIMLSPRYRLSVEDVIEGLKGLDRLEELICSSTSGTHPLNWRLWNVAKRFGLIEKGAKYDRRIVRMLSMRYYGTPVYREALGELMLEKYDLKKAKLVVEALKEGKIRIVGKRAESFSKLSRRLVDQVFGYSAVPKAERAVIELVKDRLVKTKHRLVCFNCGRYESIVSFEDVKEPIRCKVCGSALMTATYPGDRELAKLVRRWLKGKKLSEEEKKRIRRAWKIAELLVTYGKKALLVLAGFGVGADTASRILGRSLEGEELYRAIYEAELNYVRTRSFWED